MKTCFGYIRVSTARQGDGASLEAQRDAITGFASQNNLIITKWFEELETASKTGRPLFDGMLRSLRGGEAEGLVIHRIDRSSRNYSDWARLDEISRMGVKIFFAADSLDFDSRGGRLLADIQMALAADYSRNLSLEVKKGIYGRVKHGIFPFRAPLGYLDNGGGNLKTIDPKKGPLVKLAFELYGSGEYSITSLTEEMASRGLKGLADRPVVRRNIETMLRNPFYIGKMLVCEKLYQGGHEALITTAQFQQVKAVKKNRIQKRSTKHALLFRSLVHCAECRRTLTGERQKTHIYYRCHTANCSSGTIREDRMEAQLVHKLRRLQISPDDQEEVRARLKTWLSDTGTDEIETSLRLRVADTRSRQERLTDLLVDGNISQADFDLRKQNTEFELQMLRDEIKKLETQQKAEDDLDNFLITATNMGAVFAVADQTEQRDLIKNCIEAISIEKGKLKVSPASWLKTFKAMAKDPEFTPTPEAFGLLCSGLNGKINSLV
tara:strand:+ start:2559 stop:4040 length:1482 start_codon:yes stop_codon:yes gene_type:complete